MVKDDFQYGGWNSWHDHNIDFARWLHPAMWHVALESWQWIHQVAAPCNVIRGSGMTCHWIRPMAAPRSVTCSSGIMTLNSPGGNTLQYGRWLWDDMPLNSPKRRALLEFYFWFRYRPYHRSRHVILHQSAKFYPNRTTLGRIDVMLIFKMGDLRRLGF